MRAGVFLCLVAALAAWFLAPQAYAKGLRTVSPTGYAAAQESPALDSAAVVVPPATGAVQEYVLGVGDRFKMTVYGEDDLSGEYEVSSTGQASLPLIGSLTAAGQTVRQFEQAVREKLAGGYLNDPRVSIQVSNYRPFFILGEVSKPGSYSYVNGMTVLNAVAMAGGYTYRADKSGVVVIHAKDTSKTEVPVGEEAEVQPGDIIRIPERFF